MRTRKSAQGMRCILGKLNQEPPDVIKAYEALQAVQPTNDWLIRARIYGQSETDNILNSVLGKTLTLSRQVCAGKMFGKRCPDMAFGSCQRYCLPPACDHTSMLLKNKKPIAIVTQPYGLSHSSIAAMIEWAQAHTLEMMIDARLSWHFPSQTIAVVFTRKGEGWNTWYEK